MEIFKSARIKLTAWYLVVIMVISLFFSVLAYNGFLSEFRRGLRIQAFRYVPRAGQNVDDTNSNPSPLFGMFNIPSDDNPTIETQIFNEARSRVLIALGIINGTILVISGLGGYFLAGRTLTPIEEMVDEQKRFVADASHELRTPLTALKTEIEVALLDKNLKLDDAKGLLKSNLEEANKMQGLSNYLLSLSRYQNDGTQFSFDKIDLSKIAEKVIEKLKALTTTKKINIIKELKKVELKANESSMDELVSILIDNAIKYSDKGGKIIIKTKKEGKDAIIEVQDFGIGIKSGDIPYIFNRFYRADISRTKTKVDGFGLGLSIAKSIAELHNGGITVSSKPGEGSKFTVVLPIKKV